MLGEIGQVEEAMGWLTGLVQHLPFFLEVTFIIAQVGGGKAEW